MADYEKKVNEMQQEDMEKTPDVYELIGDNGELIKFNHLATLEYKNEWYVVFEPLESFDDISVETDVIMQIATDDKGDDVFVPVENEKTLNEVFSCYQKLVEENDEHFEG